MVSFVNFARIVSLCVGFHLGTLYGYVFHQDFWPNLNFQLKYQIKLVLPVITYLKLFKILEATCETMSDYLLGLII